MAVETMIDRTTAMIAPGILGANRLNPKMHSTVNAAKANVCHWISFRMGEQVPLLLEPGARALGDAEHVGDLPGEHLDADAGEEADQDRGAEEVPEEPESEDPREDQQEPHSDRDDAAVGEPLRRSRRHAADRGRPEAGRQQGGGGRVRADDEELRRAEEREERSSGRSPCTGR